MKSKILVYKSLGLLLAGASILFSCKNTGDYDYNSVNNKEFDGTIYQYLESKNGVFDSLLKVVDERGLTETLKSGQITLFAVQNKSFEQVVEKYNLGRALKGKHPLYLSDMNGGLIDSLISRYIIDGIYLADFLAETDGKMMKGVRYDYPMNAKLKTADASGYKSGGPGIINFSFTRKSIFSKDWVSAIANSINIKTKNGVIHVLEDTHPFGFGEYTKPLPEPFDKSVFRPAGTDTPFEFPAIAGEKIVIEAEDYDLGGQGVAYNDSDVANKAASNYRPTEGVDIDAPHPAGTDAYGSFPSSYSIGNTVVGEWLLYTFNVPVDGKYVITTRAASNGDTSEKKFRLEVDYIDVTGPLSFLRNSSWTNFNILISSPEIFIKAGTHTLKFYCITNGFNISNFAVTRVD